MLWFGYQDTTEAKFSLPFYVDINCSEVVNIVIAFCLKISYITYQLQNPLLFKFRLHQEPIEPMAMAPDFVTCVLTFSSICIIDFSLSHHCNSTIILQIGTPLYVAITCSLFLSQIWWHASLLTKTKLSYGRQTLVLKIGIVDLQVPCPGRWESTGASEWGLMGSVNSWAGNILRGEDIRL